MEVVRTIKMVLSENGQLAPIPQFILKLQERNEDGLPVPQHLSLTQSVKKCKSSDAYPLMPCTSKNIQLNTFDEPIRDRRKYWKEELKGILGIDIKVNGSRATSVSLGKASSDRT